MLAPSAAHTCHMDEDLPDTPIAKLPDDNAASMSACHTGHSMYGRTTDHDDLLTMNVLLIIMHLHAAASKMLARQTDQCLCRDASEHCRSLVRT